MYDQMLSDIQFLAVLLFFGLMLAAGLMWLTKVKSKDE